MTAPLILASNTITGGYEVANSLRFDDGSSDNLSRTISTNGNLKTFTFSCWVKRANITGSVQTILSSHTTTGGTFYTKLKFDANERLHFQNYPDAYADRTWIITNQVFRDISAWYHIVVASDTTQATASNRTKIYVNGEQVTSFSEETQPSQNRDNYWNNTTTSPMQIGRDEGGRYLDGYLAEVCYIDGSQLDPTSFGEFDEDTGIWKPIDVSGLTFGTQGFYLDFEDSSALGNDVSGNNNDFTVNNLTSIDQTTDTCTNNYATLNPLHSSETSTTNFFTSLGNLELTATNNDFGRQMGITLNPENMKGYFEMKIAVDDNFQIHIQDIERKLRKDAYNASSSNPTWMFNGENIYYGNGSGWTTQISNYLSTANGDIVGVAFDFTGSNKNIWFHTNGTYGNNGSGVGNPATGDYPAITASNLNTADHYAFIFSVNTGGSDSSIQLNFGSPNYSESGGNSDDAGYGNFNQTVPTGFHALNTKNLAEYG